MKMKLYELISIIEYLDFTYNRCNVINYNTILKGKKLIKKYNFSDEQLQKIYERRYLLE
jgi:hypothetical protein